MDASVEKLDHRSTIVWGGVCTLIGLLTAWHYNAYMEIRWGVAVWWGLKDWYLWGIFGLLIVHGSRTDFWNELEDRFRAPLLVVLALAVIPIHSVVAVSLSFLIEYDGPLSLSDAVSGHILKRIPQNVLIYLVILALARFSAKETDPKPEERASSRPLRRILVRSVGREKLIDVRSIVRIESEGNYVRIHEKNGRALERRTMASLETMLPKDQFLRVHRSHIVNLDFVDRMEPAVGGTWSVILQDGTSIPMGRKYRRRIAEAIGRSL